MQSLFLFYLVGVALVYVVPSQSMQIIDDISNCPQGYFCQLDPSTKSITPTFCPPGTSSGVGASTCTPCRSGYFNIRFGSAYCDICPIAHRCANASSPPEPCPLGTANPSLGQIVCTPCLAGFYTPTLQSPACTVCPHGHVCPKADEKPKQCPAGRRPSSSLNLLLSHLMSVCLCD